MTGRAPDSCVAKCPECGGTSDCSGNDACKHFPHALSDSPPSAEPHGADTLAGSGVLFPVEPGAGE